MRAIKRVFISSFLLGGFFSGQAAHADIPISDAANVTQAIQDVMAWGQQYQQMVLQVQQMQQQIQQMQQQYAALAEARGLGDALSNPATQQVVPSAVTSQYCGVGQAVCEVAPNNKPQVSTASAESQTRVQAGSTPVTDGANTTAATQAHKEPERKRTEKGTPSAASTFVYQPPH